MGTHFSTDFYVKSMFSKFFDWDLCEILNILWRSHLILLIHTLPAGMMVLGDPEVTASLYCNFAYLYWEGCVICSLYLR